jgi:hypothetical protein
MIALDPRSERSGSAVRETEGNRARQMEGAAALAIGIVALVAMAALVWAVLS